LGGDTDTLKPSLFLGREEGNGSCFAAKTTSWQTLRSCNDITKRNKRHRQGGTETNKQSMEVEKAELG